MLHDVTRRIPTTGISIKISARVNQPLFIDDGSGFNEVTLAKVALTEFFKNVELLQVFAARFKDRVDPILILVIIIEAVNILLYISL